MQVEPDARDPQRFLVRIAFQAQTPFGAVTPHEAWFYFRPAAQSGDWVVTATLPPKPKKQVFFGASSPQAGEGSQQRYIPLLGGVAGAA